ncbi:peptide ABC transporter [Tumebacillus avium]|uniref:Peptide ABC transporter n=1 Tax=Tumebacillus avium TaxID=1903704 RepID=A0A1Y0ITR2_9BACL|nr:peptide ABC transporter [Tumebacillus avium]
MCCLLVTAWPGFAEAEANVDLQAIESFVRENMDDGNIPGLSVVIVQGGQETYKKGFGYADTSAQQLVEHSTLFELGSNSKAFTGLAVLQLVGQGKIKLDEPVQTYLPWLRLMYRGDPANVTVEQFLHHTSGLPFQTIGDIEASTADDALEQTVRKLDGYELANRPGEVYEYATVNYDVLGLLVQTVSGRHYETYMAEQVLQPLGLSHTVLRTGPEALPGLATGYKPGFLSALAYDAPTYRGNTPAGYLVSNADDMEKWLRFQLGLEQHPDLSPLIEQSRLPDRSVKPYYDGSSYAAGWQVYQKGSGEIAHGGNNPNFSSYIVFRPEDQLGVAVLANMNSAVTAAIGQGIMDMMLQKTPVLQKDLYQQVDTVAVVVIALLVPMSLVTLGFLVLLLRQVRQGTRQFTGNGKKIALGAGLAFVFLAGFTACLYKLPDVLFSGLPWGFVYVWTPCTLFLAIGAVSLTVLLLCLYFLLSFFFKKNQDRALFALIVLGLASGFGNAFIIFVINKALQARETFNSGLFLYFVMGIVLYVFGQRLIRTRLIDITNRAVFDKRMELINKILRTSYQKLQSLEEGKIQASLNNDTETVSRFSNIVVTSITSLITLVCCFVYLGYINLFGLLASIAVVAVAVGLYLAVGNAANRLWEETRDIQNVFFKFILDLNKGFKELYLHQGRRNAFRQDMEESCDTYREKRTRGDMKFANVFVIGELLFTFVIGGVAFLFPLLFTDVETETLVSFVFVFLYMTGPLHNVMNGFPELLRVRISWQRIQQLIDELSQLEAEAAPALEVAAASVAKTELQGLELRGVEYRYKAGGAGQEFQVGPVDYSFHPGEVVFITGGNGSGKSTLSKLITGLYAPDGGEILLNGERMSPETLGQHFATVFSDFYLFEKLYGIDYEAKREELERHMKVLQLEEKLTVQDGVFSTIRLSTGQRKRIALLISYLEDRPVYLFDEWAADQDPEFREFFYLTLLPEMKRRGKLVIAVTHDDRYFHLADRVIKMELGQIANQEE